MNTINTIKFNDGELLLQKDNEGNLLLCAVGELAHKYYYKFSRIADNKKEKAFDMFNNCQLLF